MKAILLNTPYTREHLFTSIGDVIDIMKISLLFYEATITYDDGHQIKRLLRKEDFQII